MVIKKLLSELFDVLFVLILCFLTLLIPMLMQGKVIVGSGGSAQMHYRFYLPTFLLTVAVIIAYMAFVLHHSEKELRPMIGDLYDRAKSGHTGTDEKAGH